MPLVVVIAFDIGRNLGGSLAAFRGGRAGFGIADEKPIVSGTVEPKGAKDELKKVASALELTTSRL